MPSTVAKGYHFNSMPSRSHDEHIETSPSADDCNDERHDENMFILKRIMVIN